ncbi:MAG: hypothetical protein AB8B73_05435 [Ekhidna sp.]
MKKLILLLLWISSITSFGQTFSSQVFHEGFLVTSNQDTVRGSLKYDLETNILILVRDGKTRSYSSQKVFYFEIYDDNQKNYRQFYSIPYNVNYDYKIPIFFELIYEGKLSLLQRESIVQQNSNANSAYWGSTVSRMVVVYDYFFLDSKGKLQFFGGKKKDLYRILTKKQSELKKFVKDNRLDPDDIRDLIRIISFYNSI